MDSLSIIDEHIIIRETIGYEGIKDVEVYDLPQILQFLRIVHNYQKMVNLQKTIE